MYCFPSDVIKSDMSEIKQEFMFKLYFPKLFKQNIKSEGITKWSIQVPGDGQPIILLSDHPTIGGYPKIANVITADYDKLVQKTPGSKLKFKLVELSVAESAFKDYIKRLNFF